MYISVREKSKLPPSWYEIAVVFPIKQYLKINLEVHYYIHKINNTLKCKVYCSNTGFIFCLVSEHIRFYINI